MEWGSELFDRYEELMKHLANSIDFMEHLLRMSTDRTKAEFDYAKQVKRLVSKNQLKKRDDYGGDTLSYEKAYNDSLQEINSIALQHEVVAENIKQSVIDPTNKSIAELRKAKSHFQAEYNKMEKTLNRSAATLENAFKKYRTAHQEMIKADEMYKAAEENRNLARVEVDRQKQYAENKRIECERFKGDYALQLEGTNKTRKDYFQINLPALLNDIQEADKKRTQAFTQCLKAVAESEKSVMHTISVCHDGIVKCADSIDWEKDADKIVDALRSGYPIPSEIPFTDLDTMSAAGSADSLTTAQHPGGTGTLRSKKAERGTFPWFKSKPKENDLGPEQRRKKITESIKQTQKEIAQEEHKKNSMMKLMKTYENDPQSANKVKQEIDDADAKLQTLHAELSRLEVSLNEVTGGNGTSSNGQLANSSSSVRSSTLSTQSSRVDESRTSTVRPYQMSRSDDDDFDDEFDTPAPAPVPAAAPAPAPVTSQPTYLGGCIALYDFAAEDATGLTMTAGDQFYVVQMDDGSGWTLVTTLDSKIEGYVPSGYLQITLY